MFLFLVFGSNRMYYPFQNSSSIFCITKSTWESWWGRRRRKILSDMLCLFWVWAQMTSCKTTSCNQCAPTNSAFKSTRIFWSLACLMTLRFSLSLSLKRLIGLLLVLNKLLIGLYYSTKQFLDKLARVKKN
jgi:hypothetical protein